MPELVVGLVVLIACLSIQSPAWSASTEQAGNQWHSPEDIRQTAVEFVTRETLGSNGATAGQRTTVTAAELDDRLRLQKCTSKLEAFVTPGSRLASQTTVGVRCSAPKKWKLYVPVRVGRSVNVLVASRPMTAGTALVASDFSSQERDISRLHTGYMRPDEFSPGLILKRNIRAGDPLRASLLTTPNIVQRGQKLTIISGAKDAALRIRMAGTALSDGRIGQRIRVKNLSSGRTVEGIVRSENHVEVSY